MIIYLILILKATSTRPWSIYREGCLDCAGFIVLVLFVQ